MLTELDPKPDCVTVATGTTLWDIMSMMSKDDIKGTHLEDPKVQAAWAGMVVDADAGLLPRAPEAAAQATRSSPTSCRGTSTSSRSSSG